MNKELPDRYIRKTVYDLLDNQLIDGNTIKVYDVRATGVDVQDNYILMTTQTATVDKANYCEYQWICTILLDFFTKYKRQGNTGSRLLVDNIVEESRAILDSDFITEFNNAGVGLEVIDMTMTFPSDITSITDNEIVHRKFLRLELRIN